MLHLKKILFPTDYSACAERAFGHAAFLADQYEAELHVLQVIKSREPGPLTLFEDLVLSEDDIEQQLHLVAAEAGAKATPRGVRIIQSQLHAVSEAAAILDYADEHDIDLVVMGTHGRRGVERLFSGSIAEDVVRHAPCPVLTIRAGDGPMSTRAVRTILVPVDFSDSCKSALRHAKELADVYGARIEVVHVLEQVVVPNVDGLEVAVPPNAQVLEQVARSLRAFVVPETGTARVTTHVVVGHPATEVLAFAGAWSADLIVIATHGRSELKQFLLGGVSEKIVRAAPCPVFTVKSFGRDLLSHASESSVPEAAAEVTEEATVSS